MRVLDAALVIARRDFVASVWSRFFIFFLLTPVFIMGISLLIGGTTGRADEEAARTRIAVATDIESARAIKAAAERITTALGNDAAPILVVVDPADNRDAQVMALLAREQEPISAVLTGSLAQPALHGPQRALERYSGDIGLLIADARRAEAMQSSGQADPPINLTQVRTGQAAGGLVTVRNLLARGAQFIIFFFVMLLATTLVTNLVEEKANKVIEVLAAAVPVDAIFLGKLLAMLGVSLVGLVVWGLMAAGVFFFFKDFIGYPVMPAVGWPAFCLLMFLYFTTNFLLFGGLFLSVGGQAQSVRDLQTLSMPITLGQVAIFMLASAAVTDGDGMVSWIAGLVPFSSPLAMIAHAAKSPDLLIHLAALAWQALWIAIIVRIGARMFRKTVLSTSNPEPFFRFGKKPAS